MKLKCFIALGAFFLLISKPALTEKTALWWEGASCTPVRCFVFVRHQIFGLKKLRSTCSCLIETVFVEYHVL